MSIFIDLEMNTTDARLVHKKDLRNEVIEIGAVRKAPDDVDYGIELTIK